MLRKVAGRYVYLPDPDVILPLAGWQNLRLRADNAKGVWPRRMEKAGEPAHHPRKTGPRGGVMQRVVAAMLSDMRCGQLTPEGLYAYKEAALAARL